MINIRVYRLSDNKFLDDFSVGNYIGNHNEINRNVKRVADNYNCEVYYH